MAEAKEVKQSTTAPWKPCPAQLAEGLDLEEQVDELMALAAIYEGEDLEICEHGNPHADMPGGIFNIPIFPPQPFQVKLTKPFEGVQSHSSWSKRQGSAAMRGHGRGKRDQIGKNEDNTDDADTARRRRHSSSSSSEKPPTDEPTAYSIKRLCPMTLTFAFPHNYPSINPPSFTLSCCWLDKHSLSRLCQQLDCIWAEYQGCAVVMNWVSFLQGELTNFLGLQSPHDLGKVLSPLNNHHPKEEEPFDSRGIQTFGIIDEVLPKILDFNLITCEVCGEEKPGSDCLRLISCSEHTYCRECSKGWFETQVDQGAVSELTCPGYKCTKPILPTEIASVVPPSVYQRYEKLLLKTALDTMDDISYCPRPHCQFPVVLEGHMGLCHKCKHAFCSRCQNTYHGHTPCKLKADKYAQICKDYEAGSESERHQLEMLYGKRNIQTAVNETKSTQWLEVNSKQCPNCSTFIQKSIGCNQLKCTSCGNFFCWLCSASISRSNPYRHFNTDENSPCFSKLFDGVNLEDYQRHYEALVLELEEEERFVPEQDEEDEFFQEEKPLNVKENGLFQEEDWVYVKEKGLFQEEELFEEEESEQFFIREREEELFVEESKEQLFIDNRVRVEERKDLIEREAKWMDEYRRHCEALLQEEEAGEDRAGLTQEENEELFEEEDSEQLFIKEGVDVEEIENRLFIEERRVECYTDDKAGGGESKDLNKVREGEAHWVEEYRRYGEALLQEEEDEKKGELLDSSEEKDTYRNKLLVKEGEKLTGLMDNSSLLEKENRKGLVEEERGVMIKESKEDGEARWMEGYRRHYEALIYEEGAEELDDLLRKEEVFLVEREGHKVDKMVLSLDIQLDVGEISRVHQDDLHDLQKINEMRNIVEYEEDWDREMELIKVLNTRKER